MMDRIQENLSRQHMALNLLMMLLEEEYARLKRHDPQGVTPMELSIQELMRQLAAERTSLRRMVQTIDPSASRVRDIVGAMDDERRAKVEATLESMNHQEQRCGMQAGKNQQMVLALFDQSTKLLNYMHKQIVPTENKNGYSARGRYAKPVSNQAALVRGTL